MNSRKWKWKWLVVDVEECEGVGQVGRAVMAVNHRVFASALADYELDPPEVGLRVLLRRVDPEPAPGPFKPKAYWALVQAERFGKCDQRLNVVLERAGLDKWEIAL